MAWATLGPEGSEVNGDLRKTVSRRALAPSRELKAKGLFHGIATKKTRDKAPCGEERAVDSASTEEIKG